MKAAFCLNVFENGEVMDSLKVLKELGYDGVEFWDNFLVQTNLDELKTKLDSLGLETAQICPYFNVAGTREELVKTYEISEKYIAWAVKLDCKRIRVFTGGVSSSRADESTYGQGVEGLQHICDMGASHGLFFVLETHDGSLMDTGPATLRLIQDVDRPNLKINLQIPLDYGREDIFSSAEMLGVHTIHIHAHNWVDAWPDLTYLDSGAYDFKKFIGIIRSKGFDGYVSIEHGNHSGKHPYEIAEHEINYLKKEIFRMK